jgi:uncharacterized protein
VVAPHALLDPKSPDTGRTGSGGPLVAIRLHILTRKTLGGLETDLEGRVMRADGPVLPGVYAMVGAAGFGGGGVHGYRALEGTFLRGCLFSSRTAGRALAAAFESGSSLSRRKLQADTCLGKARSARNERSERSNQTGRVRVSGS